MNKKTFSLINESAIDYASNLKTGDQFVQVLVCYCPSDWHTGEDNVPFNLKTPSPGANRLTITHPGENNVHQVAYASGFI